jgi:hypothetical protein
MPTLRVRKFRDAIHSPDGKSIMLRGIGIEGEAGIEMPASEALAAIQLLLDVSARACQARGEATTSSVEVHEIRLRPEPDGRSISLGVAVQPGRAPIFFRFLFPRFREMAKGFIAKWPG